MKIILETDRLILRELTPADAESFYLLNLNPNVIRYTGNTAFENVAQAKSFLENYTDYERNGYGRWAVLTKQTEKFIGWCGLKFDELENETDLGFRFFEQEWRKGYATESAIATVDYGFKELNLERIVGRAMKENIGSIKVLEKSGFKYLKDVVFEGKEAVIYNIEKPKASP